MEHSTAILEDAGEAIQAGADSRPPPPDADDSAHRTAGGEDGDSRQNNYNRRKRKADLQHGSHRGGRGGGGGRGDHKRHKNRDMGRGEYFRDAPDKRQKTNESREKRLEGKGPQYGTQFSKEEIDAEERRPKRKVAVLIGYSGTGYKGMQISASEKTIEGDLFNAFVAAGAISKANADDPKKASLVRCARTDKGVHAAGNVISLKLIVEDDDIVARINENLSPQIRIWGIERTIGSFSCYQACDSRWYEYLIPSHAFLPPHPSSWLAKKLEELADDAGDRAGYSTRQAEVEGFWEDVERRYVDPVLADIDEDLRPDVIKALRGEDEDSAKVAVEDEDIDAEAPVKLGKPFEDDVTAGNEKTEDAAIIINQGNASHEDGIVDPPILEQGLATKIDEQETLSDEAKFQSNKTTTAGITDSKAVSSETPLFTEDADRHVRLRAATKKLRLAYTAAKRKYRIPTERVERIQAALSRYVGTANYHNFTVQKPFKDPSARRHIKSFVVNPQRILIGEGPDEEKSEWLSMKVHGQSFMMHQIRKMVGMVTLLVRCGADLSTLDHALTEARYSIPKVPGLGLLLERPVFDSYNDIQATKYGREKLDFGKFEAEMEEFKQREIYQRIFREEEERNEFGKFFNHLDNFKDAHFLYLTSGGHKATDAARGQNAAGKMKELNADV